MRYENGDVVTVYNTGSHLVDDLECKVVGIVSWFGEGVPGNHYILKPTDERLIEGYECFVMTDACITNL